MIVKYELWGSIIMKALWGSEGAIRGSGTVSMCVHRELKSGGVVQVSVQECIM